MCVCVCVCVRERERERERDRQTDRQTDRHTDAQTDRQTETQRHRERGVLLPLSPQLSVENVPCHAVSQVRSSRGSHARGQPGAKGDHFLPLFDHFVC